MKRLLTLSGLALGLGVGLALALLGVLGAGLPAARAATLTNIGTTLDDFTDNGNCTLREAIEAANTDTSVDLCPAGSGADTILVPPGIYTLTIAPVTPFANSTGDLNVTEALTIEGAGPGQITINANGIDRALYVEASAGSVVISGVTIYNGNAATPGGGIYNDGADLVLINTVVVSNTSGNAGGGVCVQGGSLAVEGGRVVSNTAGNGGGGLYVYAADALLAGVEVSANSAPGTNGRGGGLRAYDGGVGASVTLSGARVLTNAASAKGGGVYLGGVSTAFTMTGGSVVANNRADGTGASDGGGGLYVAESSVLLGDGWVFSNTATYYGGGVFLQVGSVLLDGGVIVGNAAETHGGGLYVNSGSATLARGEIISNAAKKNNGGGVYLNQSTAFLTQTGVCTIAHNTAKYDGGGVHVNLGSATLAEGPLFDNVAQDDGGGLYVEAGSATLDGTRVVSNTAHDRGGGLYVVSGSAALDGAQIVSNTAHYAVGGAWLDGTATLVNTTVSRNRAVAFRPGGIRLGAGAAVTITFSTVASNTATGSGHGISFGGPLAAGYIQNTLVAYNGAPLSNCLGILPASGGYNLEDGDTCGFAATGDITGTDPLLGPLTEDRGTLVHPLLDGSPAIDGGLCTGVAVDQRGVARPEGAVCDVGAYEWVWYEVYLPLVLRNY